MSSICVIHIVIVLFLSNTGVLGQQFASKPINKADVTSSKVVLDCSSSDPGGQSIISWTEYITNPAGTKIAQNGQILNNHPRAASYDMSDNNLMIQAIQSDDAGQYSCQISDIQSIDSFSELIVLESDPKCSSNPANNTVEENEDISFTCEVNFNGLWAPTVQWSDNSGSVTNDTTSSTMKYTLTVTPTREDNGKTYRAEVLFLSPGSIEDDGPGSTYAKNAPEYRYPWESLPIVVQFEDTTVEDTTMMMTTPSEIDCGNGEKAFTLFTMGMALVAHFL